MTPKRAKWQKKAMYVKFFFSCALYLIIINYSLRKRIPSIQKYE